MCLQVVVYLVRGETEMNLLFQIPEHLNSILVARAAENGKDVESFVIDAICERLEASTECSTSSDFNSGYLRFVS